jgi:acyl-CoA thioesterase-1
MKPAVVCLLALAIACEKPAGRQSTDSQPANPPTRQPDTRKIIFAGTSLTAGLGLDPDSAYPRLIQRKLDSAGLDFESVNAGVSGETTAGLLQRLDWLLRGSFDVFVIESGANDGLRGVDVEAVESNLRQIIQRVRAAQPSAKIALVQMEALPNYGRSYGTAFHDLYVRIAKDEHVTLLPFLLDRVAGRPELNQNDGMHPNVEGERIVAENVWRGLVPVLRSLP